MSAYPISTLRTIKALNIMGSYYCCRSRMPFDDVTRCYATGYFSLMALKAHFIIPNVYHSNSRALPSRYQTEEIKITWPARLQEDESRQTIASFMIHLHDRNLRLKCLALSSIVQFYTFP